MKSEKQNKSPRSKPLSGIPVVADYSKPLDFLFHCHQRIAANLESLRRATAEFYKTDPNEIEQAVATIDTVLTQLAAIGAKHTRDEEDSLFPRLREHRDDVVSEVFEVVDQLEAQHKRAASIEESLNKMTINLAASDTLSQDKFDLFNDLAESLYDLYKPHIQMENDFVFPTAAKLLTAEEQFEMGREFYQRRQLKIGRE